MTHDKASFPLQIDRSSARWPAELSAIADAPECLWLRGKIDLLALQPRVAIVGTRAPTPYGQAQAARFARALAAKGVCVVSGLARGIDAAAHESVLEAGGATLGVLGSSVDLPWPPGPLAERMAQNGLLLSELWPGTGPRKQHFPRRNRLISGLSQAVVVIEAAAASGSLITAHWAVDQGREVFALPGRVDHPMARGCHRLIREGALLVEDPEEVLEILGIQSSAESVRAGDARNRCTQPTGLAFEIWEALHGETLGPDELAERLRGEAGGILTALVELELAGFVARCPGGLYRRLS